MIKIRRKDGMPPATCISYPCDGDCTISRGLTTKAREEDPAAANVACPQVGSHYEQWRPDPDKKEFSVSAVIAAAALESGFFEGVPDAQARVKQRTDDGRPATADKEAV